MRTIHRTFILLIVLFLSAASVERAMAQTGVNNMRFCANFVTSYQDSMSGQDNLVNGTAPANKHWAVIERGDGTQAWSGYMADNCTPWVVISAQSHKFFVTTAVRVAASKHVFVYRNSSEQWEWFLHNQTTLANPIGNSTFVANFTATEPAHVSLVASLMGSAELVTGSNLQHGVYKVYADVPSALSHYSPSNELVTIGSIPQTGNDAFWKSVVAHELGHYVAHKLFGEWHIDYSLNAGQAICSCDHIPFAPDRSHCLQSREQMGAARGEGWGHACASFLFNIPSHSTAPFGYYKNFLNPGSVLIQPPVNADALVQYRWMSTRCDAANRGVELDWLGFFYFLRNRTANAYTFANFRDVFLQECGGTCSFNTVTWSTLVAATNVDFGFGFGFGSGKYNHLVNTGDVYGVD